MRSVRALSSAAERAAFRPRHCRKFPSARRAPATRLGPQGRVSCGRCRVERSTADEAEDFVANADHIAGDGFDISIATTTHDRHPAEPAWARPDHPDRRVHLHELAGNNTNRPPRTHSIT